MTIDPQILNYTTHVEENGGKYRKFCNHLLLNETIIYSIAFKGFLSLSKELYFTQSQEEYHFKSIIL